MTTSALHRPRSMGDCEDPLRDNVPIDKEPPPLLLVKITGYRLLTVTVTVAFVVAKAIMTQQGRPAASTLDWVSAGVLGIVSVRYLYRTMESYDPFFFTSLWCAGWFESVDPQVWPWFFHRDYARSVPPFIAESMFIHSCSSAIF